MMIECDWMVFFVGKYMCSLMAILDFIFEIMQKKMYVFCKVSLRIILDVRFKIPIFLRIISQCDALFVARHFSPNTQLCMRNAHRLWKIRKRCSNTQSCGRNSNLRGWIFTRKIRSPLIGIDVDHGIIQASKPKKASLIDVGPKMPM
jgi:hypothetical protein